MITWVAAPTPSTDASPGLWGFVSFAVLAVALYFLMRNMNDRMRRMSYRQRDAGRDGSDPQATEADVTAGEDQEPTA